MITSSACTCLTIFSYTSLIFFGFKLCIADRDIKPWMWAFTTSPSLRYFESDDKDSNFQFYHFFEVIIFTNLRYFRSIYFVIKMTPKHLPVVLGTVEFTYHNFWQIHLNGDFFLVIHSPLFFRIFFAFLFLPPQSSKSPLNHPGIAFVFCTFTCSAVLWLSSFG